MNFRIYLLLFFIAGIALLGIATLESHPGYMDADYYYANGLRIANGLGWNEAFLWNYLSDPAALPAPAYTYWMPLAGILAGLGIQATGLVDFWGARIFFILIAACIAPLTAYLSYTFLAQRWGAILAGSLAILSGFYYAYLPTTETFGIYMLAGAIIFILVRRLQVDSSSSKKAIIKANEDSNRFSLLELHFISPAWIYLLLGITAGSMYLTRADGLLWLGICWLAILMQGYKTSASNQKGYGKLATLLSIAICGIGFLLVISPWAWRNLNQFGLFIAPGSGRALWLTDYDDLFIFPASQLTFQRWLDSGFAEIVKSRARAFGLNLMSSFAVQGVILLGPLIFAGMWVKRRDWRVILGAVAWLIDLLLMTLIFPYQGARGGFFHAGAALQPLFWALVPVGLMSFITWGKKNRGWDSKRALGIFSSGIIGLLLLVTAVTTWQRLNGRSNSTPAWGETEKVYPHVEELLSEYTISPDEIVMVNNPPGYYAMTGRSAIVIPDGELGAALQAGEKFKASFLILDENHPQGMKDQFENPQDYPGMRYLESLDGIRIYYLER